MPLSPRAFVLQGKPSKERGTDSKKRGYGPSKALLFSPIILYQPLTIVKQTLTILVTAYNEKIVPENRLGETCARTVARLHAEPQLWNMA